MVRTQIQLTENQVQVLKRIAESRRVSVAKLLREAVDTMIDSSPLVDPGERYKRAMDIVGRFGSGKRDISRKHDDYLLDAYSK